MPVINTITRFFPPPRYLTMPSVGVDISDTSLKYIQFERKHIHDPILELKHWGDLVIPSGVVERGKVHDGSQLKQILLEMKERTAAEYIRVSLPEERAYLFEAHVKRSASRKEARSLIEFSLEENVPLSPRDAYFDFDYVGGDEAGATVRVAVAVYAKETIDSYYEACRAADMLPLSFEIEAQAIARAAVRSPLESTYMIVDFGKTRMGVGIVQRGTLMYTSTIDISGAQMSTEMRELLGDLSESELTQIKNTRGLLQSKENRAVSAIIKKVIDSAIEELQVRIQYWQTRDTDHSERMIRKIILCGGSSNLYGLPEYLFSRLNVPVERAEVWQNAFPLSVRIPPIHRRYSYGYATAIGLALKDFEGSHL